METDTLHTYIKYAQTKKKFLNYHFTYANLYFTFVDFNKDIYLRCSL